MGEAGQDRGPIAPRLSVVVVARDEEERIAACLEAARFADELLVVDTGSLDRTRDIAAAHGARVEELPWEGFGPTKAAALALARGAWILLLDADEVVDTRLAASIQAVVSVPDGADRQIQPEGYELCRRALFLGRWMGHGGWYPDWVLRLVRRGSYTMSADLVHESLRVGGRVARLAGELRHHTDPDLPRYLQKMVSYADLSARSLHAAGRRCRVDQLLLHPPAMFLKRYVLQAGCLDGVHGLLLALLSSVHVLIKYARLWELGRRQ